MHSYQPIACHIHDTYEIAIMHQTALNLDWRQDGIQHRETVQPLDLCTRDGAEWLLVRDSKGNTLSIRLDWIREAIPDR